MLWSKEINKQWGKARPRFYKNCWAVAKDGYYLGKPVHLVTVALKAIQDGDTCPYCGDKADPNELTLNVNSEHWERGKAIPKDPYIEASCQCAKCKQWWVVRQKGTEVCLDYYPPRNGYESYELSETALHGAYCGKTGSK